MATRTMRRAVQAGYRVHPCSRRERGSLGTHRVDERSKPHQLEANLGALNVRLSPEELRRLDELSPHASYYPNWFTTMVRDQATDKALGSIIR